MTEQYLAQAHFHLQAFQTIILPLFPIILPWDIQNLLENYSSDSPLHPIHLSVLNLALALGKIVCDLETPFQYTRCSECIAAASLNTNISQQFGSYYVQAAKKENGMRKSLLWAWLLDFLCETFYLTKLPSTPTPKSMEDGINAIQRWLASTRNLTVSDRLRSISEEHHYLIQLASACRKGQIQPATWKEVASQTLHFLSSLSQLSSEFEVLYKTLKYCSVEADFLLGGSATSNRKPGRRAYDKRSSSAQRK
ncbi:hypothetical protein BKA56DRAFT_622164 [Ilyonectria sp. MPI-CAGE-AT-0026]|nr:hypothetical protein BKA56DRAFT_622164 [Ilyonectria sp. MPI-CAGE-AT-0026]